MVAFKSTRDVARRLGVTTSLLGKALWDERIDAPGRAPSGAYLWTEEDIERASWQIHGCSLAELDGKTKAG